LREYELYVPLFYNDGSPIEPVNKKGTHVFSWHAATSPLQK